MISHPYTLDSNRVIDAYGQSPQDRRFTAPALLGDEQANALVDLAIKLCGFDPTSDFIHDLVGEAGAKGKQSGDAQLGLGDMLEVMCRNAPGKESALRDLADRFDWKGQCGSRIHESEIWVDRVVRLPRPAPRPRPTPPPRNFDPFRVLGEAGNEAAYMLVFNGDDSLQVVYRKDNADMEKLAEAIPELKNVRTATENDAQASRPLAERLAAWNNVRYSYDAHAIKPIDTTPQEFGKNVKLYVISRDGRILGGEEWTNEDNKINITTLNWRGTVVGRNSVEAADQSGPRIDMDRLEGELIVRRDKANEEANAILGFNLPASEATGYLGAKPRLVRDGGARVQVTTGDSEKESLNAHTPYLGLDDEGVGVTWGTDAMPRTRVHFSGDLGDVYCNQITVTSEGLTKTHEGKGDTRAATVPWYFMAVPEAEQVKMGNKTLAELFALGSTKFDAEGNETNGITVTPAQLAEFGIEVSMMDLEEKRAKLEECKGDQYARIQLAKDWVDGAGCKDFDIEVAVHDVAKGYVSERQAAGKDLFDAKLQVSDQYWFKTPSAHVMIRLRRRSDNAEVARLKINFDPEGDTPFARDFADMELYDKYEYVIRRGEQAKAEFGGGDRISAPEMGIREMMSAVKDGGYTFHQGAQEYRIVSREKAYADACAAGNVTEADVAPITQQIQADKANNWWVVQRVVEGNPEAILRDAADAVDTDVRGHLSIYAPNHFGTDANTRLYIGKDSLDFGAVTFAKDIPVTVEEGATGAQIAKAKAEALENGEHVDYTWEGYSTPDKTRDGFGTKKGDDFEPRYLGTIQELNQYCADMKQAQDTSHIRKPKGETGDQDSKQQSA